jgi:hypothetical protein
MTPEFAVAAKSEDVVASPEVLSRARKLGAFAGNGGLRPTSGFV